MKGPTLHTLSIRANSLSASVKSTVLKARRSSDPPARHELSPTQDTLNDEHIKSEKKGKVQRCVDRIRRIVSHRDSRRSFKETLAFSKERLCHGVEALKCSLKPTVVPISSMTESEIEL